MYLLICCSDYYSECKIFVILSKLVKCGMLSGRCRVRDWTTLLQIGDLKWYLLIDCINSQNRRNILAQLIAMHS